MNCLYCNVEMIKKNFRGLSHIDMPYGVDTNSLILNIKKTNKTLLGKDKESWTQTCISTDYYICPKCGIIIRKISENDLTNIMDSNESCRENGKNN